MHDTHSVTEPDARSESGPSPHRRLVTGVVLLALVATLGGLLGGPALGDHEAIVAQCARDMRLSGDWIVPRFLDTAFVRKPPLPYWLVAGASYLFPNDPRTGLPVTTSVARLPSALAAFGTVLLLWRLGSAMFSRRTGLVTAVVACSSLFILLYAANATAEMLLTFCCTWAYTHFWFAVTGRKARGRLLHLLLFYVALGSAMLAKGPAPISMTVMPLVFWWYTERSWRVLARRGPGALARAGRCFVLSLWPRTVQAFTRLWLLPGLVICGLLFVPWMWAAAAGSPNAWNLWNWQYLQRAQGDYEDTRVRGVFYYVPIVAGYVMPWLFLIVEGAAAPWLKRYARYRRGLLYAGLWAGVGIVVMSVMEFKKPYYVGPAMPGLILLLSAAAERVLSYRVRSTTWAWMVLAAFGVAGLVALVPGARWVRQTMPEATWSLTAIAGGALVLVLLAGASFIRKRGWAALSTVAATAVLAFYGVWYSGARSIDRLDKIPAVAGLAATLDQLGLPPQAEVYWADQRPDARLSVLFDRRSRHMLPASEIVAQAADRMHNKQRVQEMAFARADELLARADAVYLILDREHYEQWSSHFASRARLAGVVQNEVQPSDKDWVILTNAAGSAP